MKMAGRKHRGCRRCEKLKVLSAGQLPLPLLIPRRVARGRGGGRLAEGRGRKLPNVSPHGICREEAALREGHGRQPRPPALARLGPAWLGKDGNNVGQVPPRRVKGPARCHCQRSAKCRKAILLVTPLAPLGNF